MSGIPQEIPLLGSVDQRVRQNPRFDPTKAGSFTSEDYFVWSRIDGFTSLRDLLLMVAFPPDKTSDILRKLRDCGAVLLPDESPDEVAERLERAAAEARKAAELDEIELRPEEEAAMEEDVALDDRGKRRVIAMLRKVEAGDYYDLLGVEPDVGKRALKRAYFKVSKEFHPDRYYGKPLGSFEEWLTRIFDTAHKAFDVLSDPTQRGDYDRRRSGKAPVKSAGSQTPRQHAAELFERACNAEVSGRADEAAQLFAASVRVDPRARYVRRAASFSLKVGKLQEAEEYAKKAAELRSEDPSYARLLADVYRAAGKLAEAEATLVYALELKSENDTLLREIEDDLTDVRRQRSRAGQP